MDDIEERCNCGHIAKEHVLGTGICTNEKCYCAGFSTLARKSDAIVRKPDEMKLCTCGHFKYEHGGAGCGKCICMIFSETVRYPTISIGVMVEDESEDE